MVWFHGPHLLSGLRIIIADYRFTDPLITRVVPSPNDAEESQFFVPSSSRRMLLSGHSYGPFIRPPTDHGSIVEIYTSGTCGLKEIRISLNWKASIGRVGTRYWSSLPMWVMGIVYLSVGVAWISWDDSCGGRSLRSRLHPSK